MFSKLMCANITETQKVGKRPYASTTQPFILLAWITTKLKTFQVNMKDDEAKCSTWKAQLIRKTRSTGGEKNAYVQGGRREKYDG